MIYSVATDSLSYLKGWTHLYVTKSFLFAVCPDEGMRPDSGFFSLYFYESSAVKDKGTFALMGHYVILPESYKKKLISKDKD